MPGDSMQAKKNQMSQRSVGRNSPCPCGSGKKYKQCCIGKSFDFVEDDDDATIRRVVPMPDELADALPAMMQQRSEELGRELRPDDKLFDGMKSERDEHEMVQSMQTAGVDPAIIYAFTETGLLVSEDNQHLIPEKDLALWHAAIQRHRAQAADRDIDELPMEAVMEFFDNLATDYPDELAELKSLATQFDDPEEFANAILIGPCPKCESESTEGYENDPQIDDGCVGRCRDCGQLFCCDCECLFDGADEAVKHDCPAWVDSDDDEAEAV